MRKLILGIVASVFAVSTAAAYKVEPLTNDQRAEMRARAERMKEEREHQPMHDMNAEHHEMHHKATHHKTNHHGEYHHKAPTTS
jgi:hypothetical protein